MPEDEAGRTPPTEDRVRVDLLLFAELVRELDERGLLMTSLPTLLGRLSELRRLLFDFEVRSSERLLPVEDPQERESRRILQELEERKEEMIEEWGDRWSPEDADREGDDDEEEDD